MNKKINSDLLKIYDLMYNKDGHRNWWPAETGFEMIIGALLAQFVSWKNVTTAIDNLKAEGLLSINEISSIDTGKLENLIRATRFYKQKAKKLKVFCSYLMDNYNCDLNKFFDKDLYSLRKELLSLYGIGEETADSIILYAAEKPIFVVDSYTRRVFGKLGYFNKNTSYGEMQKFFMDNLEHNVELFNDFHAQIDGVGAEYCLNKNPRCDECPVNIFCKDKGD
ncbi:MAG: endonuclease III domain-containing protein [Clostridia bacterium]|nr:endonuclease III domain-containing protein [Clostridia bacterium]